METLAFFRLRRVVSAAAAALVGSLLVSVPAAAQPPPAAPPPGAPPAAPPSGPSLGPAVPNATPDPIAIALAPKTGGLTAEEAARVVSRNKHSVRSKQEDLKAAAARVDQAMVGFFPRLSLGASYTRLSPIPAFSLGGLLATAPPTAASGIGPVPVPKVIPNGGMVNVPTAAGGLTSVKCTSPTGCYQGVATDGSGGVFGVAATFPIPLNSTALTASLSVPVSDYVFRLGQTYAAASHSERSARMSAEAEALQAGADARIAYFNWVRAKGDIVVTQEAIDQSKAHLDDAKKSFAVGLSSRADVLRVDAQVAAAQQAHAESIALAAVAEEQLRVLLGVPADHTLEIGSDVMNETIVPPGETLTALQQQALVHRLELRSIDEAIASLRSAESATKAGYVPRIDAFADATYANPNQRIFPATQTWNGTWDVGVRLNWTLNDTFTTLGAAAEAKARVASLVEQRGTMFDALRVEVASAYADALKAPPTIEAADRGMVSAEESLRVRRELYRNGKATSTELIDAENDLTQARLRKLDAHIGQLVARARLDHATGRDAPARPVEQQ